MHRSSVGPQPRRPDDPTQVADPGSGQDTHPLPIEERVSAVQRATGVPVALLDNGQDPLRISAESDRIDGALRFTGSRTSYPDGVAVSVRYPTSFPDPDSETATDILEAIEACGLFEDGVLIVDGAVVRAAGYRPVAGGPVRSWTAQSGGWIVTVHGRADDGAVVRILGAQNPAAPGRPTIPGTA